MLSLQSQLLGCCMPSLPSHFPPLILNLPCPNPFPAFLHAVYFSSISHSNLITQIPFILKLNMYFLEKSYTDYIKLKKLKAWIIALLIGRRSLTFLTFTGKPNHHFSQPPPFPSCLRGSHRKTFPLPLLIPSSKASSSLASYICYYAQVFTILKTAAKNSLSSVFPLNHFLRL